MTHSATVHPLPFTGDLIDYLNLHGRKIEWLWRDGEAFIPVRPICDILGLTWQSQHRKLIGPDGPSTVIKMLTVVRHEARSGQDVATQADLIAEFLKLPEEGSERV